jgi:hypothetical protein
MLLIPGAMFALIGAHLYLVVKLGTTAPPWLKADKPAPALPIERVSAGANGASANGARTNGASVRQDGPDGSEE